MRQIKLAFLDVDGVLNDEGWGTRHGLTPSADASIDQLVRWIDPEKVELVNEIVDRTGVSLVLSSSTRTDPRMSVVLARAGLRPILTSTPVLLWPTNEDGSLYNQVSRADEVIDFLRTWTLAYDRVDKFIVIDDQEHNWEKVQYCTRTPVEEFLVRTSFATGITPDDVKLAIQLLGKS